MLRAEYDVTPNAFTKTSGQPFLVSELRARIERDLGNESGEEQ